MAEPAKALELAQQGTAVTTEIARLALMTRDSATRFKSEPEFESLVLATLLAAWPFEDDLDPAIAAAAAGVPA